MSEPDILPDIIPAGDAALVLKFGHEIDAGVHARVMHWMALLQEKPPCGVVDMIPSYCEILIIYDPCILSFHDLTAKMHEMQKSAKTDNQNTGISEFAEHLVPVLYDRNAGPDLAWVAACCRVSIEELISLHTSPTYRVYMLGFLPGFCYLGGMNRRLAVPRKDTPSLLVPAGSVGIAGNQTGIYPMDSPGGWQIIGKTPLMLFDWKRSPVFLVNPGDRIRFYSISAEEYHAMAQEVAGGHYHHTTQPSGSAGKKSL